MIVDKEYTSIKSIDELVIEALNYNLFVMIERHMYRSLYCRIFNKNGVPLKDELHSMFDNINIEQEYFKLITNKETLY